MPRFRKLPVEIEAFQIVPNGVIPEWFMDAKAAGLVRRHPADTSEKMRGDRPVIIHTLEGDMEAMPGDWIIRGVKGELYPCKPDIFEATYERVDGEPAGEDASEMDRGRTIDDLRTWIDTLVKDWADRGLKIELTERGLPLPGGQLRFVLYTARNRYSIRARDSGPGVSSYLGAQATVIQGGGRDLADGRLTARTWDSIVADIYDFEHRQGRFAP